MEGRRKVRKLQKTNKNHYPDPDWVWQQIENNEAPAAFYEKMEQKYSLNKVHGNSKWKSERGYNLSSQAKKKKDNK